jgi:hypothetical protein
MAYEPTTPQAKEQRAWQLEQQGAVRAGTELRKQAQQQRQDKERQR